VLATSSILGRGAVKDTDHLVPDGINTLVRALAMVAGRRPEVWATEHDLLRYFGSSLKGEAAGDWDELAAREAVLRSVVADADRLLAIVRHALAGLLPDELKHVQVREAA
jgi:hypothetical protein